MLMFLFKICYRVNSIFKQVEYCLNLLSTIFNMQESLIERITIDPEFAMANQLFVDCAFLLILFLNTLPPVTQ